MANFLSSGIIANNNVPKGYMVPPEQRPVSSGKIKLPVVDLLDKENSLNNIMSAARDFGLFEVINHSMSRELMNDAMEIFEEVFKLSQEEKAKINREDDLNKVCNIFTSSYNFEREKFHYWRDVLRHLCTPLDKTMPFWPDNPVKYRGIVKQYVLALKDISTTILDNISEGLGLEEGYLSKSDLSTDDILTINHYPPCPDPSSTIGLPTHVDPTLVNIVQVSTLDVPGLQLFKDGHWFDLEATPNSFFIFIGNQLEVISNGKMKASVHRAVTNAEKARTTAVFFINPSLECVVEPAKAIIEAENSRALFKSFTYQEYFKAHVGHSGDRDKILELYDFTIKY